MIERIDPAELGRPSGFSHAVVTDADRLVFLAGQTALDADGRIDGDGIVEQFEKALGNLLTALEAAGGFPEDLVGMTVSIVDMDDYRLARPGDRRRMARLARHGVPGDGRDRREPPVGRRGPGGGEASPHSAMIMSLTYARADSSSRDLRLKNRSPRGSRSSARGGAGPAGRGRDRAGAASR